MSEYVRQVQQLSTSFASRLPSIDIELTERCNNNCIHCCINLPENDVEARQREMTTDQVKAKLRQAADLGCLQVRLTGGEPLLRPDFEDLYLFARKLGMKVLLYTNARLITPRIAELFERIRPMIPIEITVYGMCKESYDAVTRVPGSFDQFWHGADLLLNHYIPFVVKYVLLPPNRGDIVKFEAWAKTIPWMTRRPGCVLFLDLRSRRDDPSKNHVIEALRLSPLDGLKELARDEIRYRDEMLQFACRFMGPSGDRLFTCGAGTTICVDAYGRTQPCLSMRSPQITIDGNVDLAEALDQFSNLRNLQAANPEYLRRCAHCFLKGLCEQCPAKSWSENGTFDTPIEYQCEIAHAQARRLGWLGKREKSWEVRRRGKHVD